MTCFPSGSSRGSAQDDPNVVRHFPSWLKRPIAFSGRQKSVCSCLADSKLHTVCVEAKCPNRSECYSRGTATFLILGNVCTRNCSFCSVGHGMVDPPDPQEPQRLAEASKQMGLRHVVITSVTRDDLDDGGAGHFAACVKNLRQLMPSTSVELLIPDFGGNEDSLKIVLESGPDVLNHNVETVPRLYPKVRPMADYGRSIELLSRARKHGTAINTKSGLMVGLGETENEVMGVMQDLRAAGCSMLTIGQYLQPSRNQLPVEEFVSPQQFERYSIFGKDLGFDQVAAGPFVRSSYRADELLKSQ